MAYESQAEIERFNRLELWRDAASHLRVAQEALEQAQSALDDLDIPHIEETYWTTSTYPELTVHHLTQTVRAVERFANLAEAKSREKR